MHSSPLEYPEHLLFKACLRSVAPGRGFAITAPTECSLCFAWEEQFCLLSGFSFHVLGINTAECTINTLFTGHLSSSSVVWHPRDRKISPAGLPRTRSSWPGGRDRPGERGGGAAWLRSLWAGLCYHWKSIIRLSKLSLTGRLENWGILLFSFYN